MQRFLLSVFLMLLAIGLSGQRGTVGTATKMDLPVETFPYALAKGVPEVIQPPFADLPCADSVFVFGAGPDNGFVTGTNGFFDLAKGQRFIYEADAPYELLDVGVAFASVDAMALDSTVTVQIYNDLGSDGSFGSLVATSNPVTLRDINLPDTVIPYTFFTFPDSVILTRDSFIVMVNLSRTYTESPDYMSIFSSDADCGDGNNAFEIFVGQDNALTVSTIQNSWTNSDDEPLNLEFLMIATVEQQEITSTRQPMVDYAPRLFPNPADGLTQLTFTSRAAGSYRSSLLDLTGRQLQAQTIDYPAGQTVQQDIDLTGLPAGVYLYRIDGPSGVQLGRLVKR
jgi:hypothetical protein